MVENEILKLTITKGKYKLRLTVNSVLKQQ